MTLTVQLNDGRTVPALAFYNEYDSHAAEWLRNLIKAGLIAPGIVDQRSIAEITPEDLDGFVQCHFFAGIGLWSYGLRQAGWADDRPIWTGSCPCQPFSAAGKQKGFTDDRHLWPVWFNNLITQCRPAVVAGEQVASALDWFDLVSHDLEGADYAVGAVDICAPGFAMESWRETGPAEWLRWAIHDCPDSLVAGALCDFADWADESLGGHDGDHIRQRLYWVGLRGDTGCSDAGLDNPAGTRYERSIADAEGYSWNEARLRLPRERSDVVGLADNQSSECQFTGAARSGWSGFADDLPTERLDHHHHHQGSQGHAGHGDARAGRTLAARSVAAAGGSDGLADNLSHERRQIGSHGSRSGSGSGKEGMVERSGDGGSCDGLEYPHGRDTSTERQLGSGEHRCEPSSDGSTGSRNSGPWFDSATDLGADAPHRRRNLVDWLFCRDGKWRPAEQSSQPLVNEDPGRVGKLRAFGNALDGECVITFCAVVREICDESESPETGLGDVSDSGLTISEAGAGKLA